MKMTRSFIWLTALILNFIGLATLYSATYHASQESIRQTIFSQLSYTFLAIALAFLASLLPTRFWRYIAPWSYLITLITLTWALVSGDQINNAASWIRLGGISLQPSEFLKITLILVLSRVLQHQRHDHPLQEIFLVLLLSALPVFLILKQPDLGSALTLLPLILALCHTAGYGLPHLGLLIACGSLGMLGIILGSAWDISVIPLHEYQISRIIRLVHQDGFSPLHWLGNLDLTLLISIGLGFFVLIYRQTSSWKRLIWTLILLAHLIPLGFWSHLGPERREAHMQKILSPYAHEPFLEEPQLRQTKYALGNGGFWGQGWLEGEQTQYQRLAYNYSDLIFASLAEEWGFVGSTAVLALFALLILALTLLASHTENSFGSLCIYGTAYILASQVIIHIGYTVGLIPMTGITLPFFSAGGSSLVMTWLGLGVACACSRNH